MKSFVWVHVRWTCFNHRIHFVAHSPSEDSQLSATPSPPSERFQRNGEGNTNTATPYSTGQDVRGAAWFKPSGRNRMDLEESRKASHGR